MRSNVPPQQDLSGSPLFADRSRFAPSPDPHAELGYASRRRPRRDSEEVIFGQPENNREATDSELDAFFEGMRAFLRR